MTKLTDTQARIVNAASWRAGNLAMPLPKGLHGAVAKKVVGMMIERGFLEEVEANTKKGEPLWRETGDSCGTTLVATSAELAAIGLIRWWCKPLQSCATGRAKMRLERSRPSQRNLVWGQSKHS